MKATKQQTEFERWINGVPVGDYLDIRARIMQETGVSRTTFSSWREGKSSPCMDKKITIAVIAKEYDGSCPFGNLAVAKDRKTGAPHVLIQTSIPA